MAGLGKHLRGHRKERVIGDSVSHHKVKDLHMGDQMQNAPMTSPVHPDLSSMAGGPSAPSSTDAASASIPSGGMSAPSGGSPMGLKKGGMALKKVDKEKNPGLSKLPTEVRHKMGYMKKGGMAQQAAIAISKKESGKYDKDGMRMAEGGSAKPGLWANINRRKRLGISRPKSKSTISPESYKNMQHGFKKSGRSHYAEGSKNWIKGAIKHPGSLRKALHVKEGQKIPAKKLEAASHKSGKMGQRARLAKTLRSFKS
jgi:hypothetical protein